MAQELRQTETAFHMLRNEMGCFPSDGDFTCGGDRVAGGITLADAIVNTNLGRYLPAEPYWPFSDEVWMYDNDNDVRDETLCVASGANVYRGVNLHIRASVEHYRVLNAIFDRDDDPDTNEAMGCGQIRYDIVSNNIHFTISATQ